MIKRANYTNAGQSTSSLKEETSYVYNSQFYNAIVTFSTFRGGQNLGSIPRLGLVFFGARYYDATLSVWLSMDPLSDKYFSMSAYMYCAGNPLILVDPDGRDWYEIKNKDTKETEIK